MKPPLKFIQVLLVCFFLLSLIPNVLAETETGEDKIDIKCYHNEGEETELECENGIIYEEKEETASGSAFWMYLFLAVLVTLLAGVMSGLTMGLMSLDLMNLKILAESGEPQEQVYAERIIPVVSKHHLLLVTLLLANAICMEALPIFLDRITSPVAAVAISVSGVLIFGEVLPQAICTRWGLAIGANMAWFVQGLIIFFYPISWPMSKVLDRLLGEENHMYRRVELKRLVEMHGEDNEGPLGKDESTIIKGAIDMKIKDVRCCMTPLSSVYMLPIDTVLNRETMKEILQNGHSRIPIYEQSRQNLKGILIIKTLILVNPDDCKPISSLKLTPIPKVNASKKLYDMLNEFQSGSSHLVAVKDDVSDDVIGVVSLEDIFEELIQEEILDETDVYVDVERKIKVARSFRTTKKKTDVNDSDDNSGDSQEELIILK